MSLTKMKLISPKMNKILKVNERKRWVHKIGHLVDKYVMKNLKAKAIKKIDNGKKTKSQDKIYWWVISP